MGQIAWLMILGARLLSGKSLADQAGTDDCFPNVISQRLSVVHLRTANRFAECRTSEPAVAL
jgi:hypothetical protein